AVESGIEEALADLESEAVAGDGEMNWLDDLTTQPDDGLETLEELEDLSLDAADDMFADLEPALAAEAAPPDPEPEPEPAQAATVSDDNDPLGGMDPLLFLESLAARQGVDASELTTSADASIDEISADALVDEPGYVPFEGSRSAREMKDGAEQEPVQDEAPVEEPEPVEFAEAPVMAVDDTDFAAEVEAEAEEMLEGAEPMEWLETLARRQGANDEELLTPAEVDVPEIPADTVVDEPGYVEYDPLSILPPDQVAEEEAELDAIMAFDDDDEGLSWLEDLAAEPDEDVADFLSFEDEVIEELTAVEDVAPAPTTMADDDPLAGMSDEDIVRAQAEGTLTPHQELAWLKRQARSLAETRDSQDVAVVAEDATPAEITAAEPAVLPDWLEEMRQTSEEDAVDATDAIFGAEAEALVAEDEALSDWLSEPDTEDATDFIPVDLTEVSLGEDVDSLWEETPEPVAAAIDTGLPDSELAAFIAGDFELDEPDTLAEALDAEYERKLAGEDEEPDWYTEAVAQAAAETPEIGESPAEEIARPVAGEPALAAAEPVDVPGWLAEEAAEETPTVDGNAMPEWLRDMEEEPAEEPAVAGDVPAWLAPEAAADDAVPEWLAGMEEERAEEPAAEFEIPEPEVETMPVPAMQVAPPEPVPALEAPAPVPTYAEIEPELRAPVAAAPLPAGELFAQYRERLEQDANDYPSRLGLARALHANQQPESSMDHYEMLIDAGQLLQDVTDDLQNMVAEHPETPRMQRLLGDALMRRGMLQDALNAYRNALDQL
ncbi:MAG: hypothetical protein K8S97_05975, partial [Anaerolineae bacterium]|nr:hypothetical protein [Anaerolineae bacterium]